VLFRERLTVPVVWWVLAAVLAVISVVIFGFYLGPVWGIGIGVAAALIAVGIFASAAVEIVVDESGLRVGRGEVEHDYLGPATGLDADQTSRRGGVEADARAHLVLRPYVSTAVEIPIDDPGDPVPYWLVSSRRPTELEAALRTARSRRVTG